LRIELQPGWYWSLPDNELRECHVLIINGVVKQAVDKETRQHVPVENTDVLLEKPPE